MSVEKALAGNKPKLSEVCTMLGCCELLAGLAEEAAELAQAELKLRRALDQRNPTPVTVKEASEKLNEEFADVLLCAAALELDEKGVEHYVNQKADRWSGRLDEAYG